MPVIPEDDDCDTIVTQPESGKHGIQTVDSSAFDFDDWDKPEKSNVSEDGKHYGDAKGCRLKLPITNKHNLSMVQVRMLVYLYDCQMAGRVPTIKRLKSDIGLAPGSGTHNPALGGVAEGTKRGKARKGLFAVGIFGSEGHGMVEKFELDIDGKSETTFTLTDYGIETAKQIKKEMKEAGKSLPGLKKYVNVYKVLSNRE